MWYLTLISIIVTVAYVGYVTYRRGELPDSISACVFDYSERSAMLCWTFFMWIAGFGGLVPLVVKLGDLGWIAFLALIGFGFLGVAPLVKGEKNTTHYLIGIATGFISQVAVVIYCPCWWLVWLVFVPLVAGAMGALNDAKEDVALCDGKGVLIAEGLCALSVWGASLYGLP